MTLVRALVLFVIFATLGAVIAPMGLDSETGELKSFLPLIIGSVFIALAGAVFLLVLFKGSLLLIDVVLFPGDPGDPPPALYKLPEWYIEEGRFGDALAEYDKISKAHPRDPACWMGMVYVLAGLMGNTQAAKKVGQKGLRKLRTPEDKDQLKQVYREATGEELKASFFF